jgi:hypothetical protein
MGFSSMSVQGAELRAAICDAKFQA